MAGAAGLPDSPVSPGGRFFLGGGEVVSGTLKQGSWLEKKELRIYPHAPQIVLFGGGGHSVSCWARTGGRDVSVVAICVCLLVTCCVS